MQGRHSEVIHHLDLLDVADTPIHDQGSGLRQSRCIPVVVP